MGANGREANRTTGVSDAGGAAVAAPPPTDPASTGHPPAGGATAALGGALARLDAWVNRLFGSRYNPLYRSGTIAAALLVVLLVTGLYLLLFYRVGDPYASVDRLTRQAWTGRWIRGLHRFASDAAVVAVAVHALRMFVQRRSWGPRALAWVSGVALLAALMVCGWTGYVMVWDVQAQLLAVEGARLLDVLPIFSEPISRSFVGERELPGAFFFLNLFAHVALPVGMGLLLWVHVSRLARPTLLPAKRMAWGVALALTALAVAWPIGMAAPADLFRRPAGVPLDLFYAFWLPVSQALPAGAVWLAGLGLTALVVLIPWWARPRSGVRPEPSVVDERLCTACEQCVLDCPYDAITLIPRTDGRTGLVARVDPSQCVSCGICAGSCAPMGVGPPGRTGRDQLKSLRTRLSLEPPAPGELAVLACARGGGAGIGGASGIRSMPIECAGNLHTSVVEMLVREGFAGVLVVACPPEDCWGREGVRWLVERMYHDREAELQERVDRARVRVTHASSLEGSRVLAEVMSFRRELGRLAREVADDVPEPDTTCHEVVS